MNEDQAMNVIDDFNLTPGTFPSKGGILVLDFDFRTFLKNPEADRLIKQIHLAHGTQAGTALPLEVLSLCVDLKDRLHSPCSRPRIYGPIRRLIRNKGPYPIQLSGLGVASVNSHGQSRLVILLSEQLSSPWPASSGSLPAPQA